MAEKYQQYLRNKKAKDKEECLSVLSSVGGGAKKQTFMTLISHLCLVAFQNFSLQ